MMNQNKAERDPKEASYVIDKRGSGATVARNHGKTGAKAAVGGILLEI